MTSIEHAGTFRLGSRNVKRLGYGAMQLAGPGVFGPPKDRAAAVAVLRAAVDSGVDHIDTSDFYGPHVTNQIIREALHPYRDGLVIVTKVGAKRGSDGAWLPAFSPAELTQAVHEVVLVLHAGDRDDAPRVRDLTRRHVAEPDVADEPLALQLGQRRELFLQRPLLRAVDAEHAAQVHHVEHVQAEVAEVVVHRLRQFGR